MRPRRAALTKRLLAALIDSVLASIVSLLPIIGGIIGLIYALSKDALMFSLTRDERWKNMSIGKKAMDIKVVKTDGGDITVADSVKRNITLSLGSFIAIVPVAGWVVGSAVAAVAALVEMILVLADPQGRRLGDRLADTLVVEAETASESR